jgi:hypothetical protein
MEENKNIEPEQPAENMTEEIIFSEQTITEPTAQQTKEMETHAQHLHHAPGKKFRHYLYEFLMLFLAVFCGFLAEYQLEHKIEKEKGYQYIQLFYEDLKTDTANFEKVLVSYKYKLSNLAGMYPCFDKITNNGSSPDCLQNLFNNSDAFPDLVYTDRTLQQLKNAGGIRLLKQPDADSILLYDNMLRLFKTSETTMFQETQAGIRNTLYSLTNFRAVTEINEKKVVAGNISLLYPESNPLLNRYFNQLKIYVSVCKSNYYDITDLKLKATSLIKYFRMKYHFE